MTGEETMMSFLIGLACRRPRSPFSRCWRLTGRFEPDLVMAGFMNTGDRKES